MAITVNIYYTGKGTNISLREKYDLHMKVERYITDAAGVPISDKAFVRS